jgi:hypothetical protein
LFLFCFVLLGCVGGWIANEAGDFICSMACAIREAYAATMTVVILVDDEHDRGDE